jgi:transcriptional regulator GlxA family with amidase domain
VALWRKRSNEVLTSDVVASKHPGPIAPPEWVATEVRIHEATRLLLDTSAPLKRIADACGFANANHFCQVFRRFQHLSPAAYRQALRQHDRSCR